MSTGTPEIVVLDYGSGNVRSATKAIEATGARVELSSDLGLAAAARGLVVPGVGAFAAVMDALRAAGAIDLIRDRHAHGLPLLGICVGSQVLFESGSEHGVETPGIGLFPGHVTRLEAPVVPHMGWNTVTPPADSAMFSGVEEERFYFVHSYAVRDLPEHPGVTTASWPTPFLAAIESGTTWATQFHPEKSGDAGAALLRNWVENVRSTTC